MPICVAVPLNDEKCVIEASRLAVKKVRKNDNPHRSF